MSNNRLTHPHLFQESRKSLMFVCAVVGATLGLAAQQDAPTTPEQWLERCDANGNGRVTCAEARAASCGAPIPVTSDHPLYQFMRDGDGDGRVCE